MVKANNYMFRPLTGHYQVVHPMKRGWGLHNIQCNLCLMTRSIHRYENLKRETVQLKTRSRHHREVTVYIVQPPTPFSLDVQPDDGLLEAETCSC
jgi:hypothetical protein